MRNSQKRAPVAAADEEAQGDESSEMTTISLSLYARHPLQFSLPIPFQTHAPSSGPSTHDPPSAVCTGSARLRHYVSYAYARVIIRTASSTRALADVRTYASRQLSLNSPSSYYE